MLDHLIAQVQAGRQYDEHTIMTDVDYIYAIRIGKSVLQIELHKLASDRVKTLKRGVTGHLTRLK